MKIYICLCIDVRFHDRDFWNHQKLKHKDMYTIFFMNIRNAFITGLYIFQKVKKDVLLMHWIDIYSLIFCMIYLTLVIFISSLKYSVISY